MLSPADTSPLEDRGVSYAAVPRATWACRAAPSSREPLQGAGVQERIELFLVVRVVGGGPEGGRELRGYGGQVISQGIPVVEGGLAGCDAADEFDECLELR